MPSWQLKSLPVEIKQDTGEVVVQLEWNMRDDAAAIPGARAFAWPPANRSYLLAVARSFISANGIAVLRQCLTSTLAFLEEEHPECPDSRLVDTMEAAGNEPFKFELGDESLMTRLEVGRGSYGLENLNIYHYSEKDVGIVVGQFVSIAFDATIILDGNHPTQRVTTYPIGPPSMAGLNASKSKGSVEIGHDVWIGMGVTILSGVTIGHGAVIGARSVVAKSVPPYAIVVGNPARVARYRFPEEEVQRLLELRWWDWTSAEILKHQASLMSEASVFLDAVKERAFTT